MSNKSDLAISNKKHEELSVQLDYGPRLVLSIPWGEDEKSIPHRAYEKLSLSGRFITDSTRMVRPLYGVRIDQDENLYLLFEIPQGAEPAQRKYKVMSFNKQGDLINRSDFIVNVPHVATWHILDFAPDHQDGIYLLELLETDQGELFHRLRRLNQRGHELWSKRGTLNYRAVDFYRFEGKFDYLIVPDKDSLYLPAGYPQRGLASFDVSTGQILSVYEWDEPSGKLTIDLSHNVYYSRVLDDALGQRHVLIRRDLINESREIIESEIQYLHDLAGVDAKGAIYPRVHNGIARLSSTGQLEWKQLIYGIVVRPEDQHIFIGSRADVVNDDVLLEVDHYDTSGAKKQRLTFVLPEHHLPVKGDLPRLVSVDATPLFYFYAGETDHQGGTMFIYTLGGHLQTILSLTETDADGFPLFDKVNQHLLPIESRVGAPSLFEIDQSGNIYIPLSDPKGFKVIRLQPNSK